MTDASSRDQGLAGLSLDPELLARELAAELDGDPLDAIAVDDGEEHSLEVARAFDIVKIMTNGGPAGRTELLWTIVARTGYENARMGEANAMSYISVLLSIFFTIFFYRKLQQARNQVGDQL